MEAKFNVKMALLCFVYVVQDTFQVNCVSVDRCPGSLLLVSLCFDELYTYADRLAWLASKALQVDKVDETCGSNKE